MRGDLVDALKSKQGDEIAVLRSVLAAIDNAEAPDIRTGDIATARTSAEVERLMLTEDDLQQVLLGELEERRQAADQLASVGQKDRADALLRQIAIIKRYLA